MSNAAWRIRKRFAYLPDAEMLRRGPEDKYVPIETVLAIIDEEIDREAERQFTRPISQQAEMSKILKEDK